MTTICKPDEVTFPKHREDQAADLQALAGDALLRGDRVGWMVLMRAARELETMPGNWKPCPSTTATKASSCPPTWRQCWKE